MKTGYPRNVGLLRALGHGFGNALRHWRIILLGWLAGLLPAAFGAWPVRGLFNRALGGHPDAAHFVAGDDIAPLADALANMRDGGFFMSLAGIGQGLLVASLLALLMAPWLSGMLVASLREGRVLGFGELWAGGWREYGRQLRLLLVALIPMAAVAVAASLVFAWAYAGHETAIESAPGEQRMRIAMWVAAALGILGWAGVEAGRAAFAADATLRSAFRAWLRGLRLLLKRPFAVLTVVVLTLLLGAGIALLLQRTGVSAQASSGLVLAMAQLAVLVLWTTRIIRLSALTALSPPPPVMAGPLVTPPTPPPP